MHHHPENARTMPQLRLPCHASKHRRGLLWLGVGTVLGVVSVCLPTLFAGLQAPEAPRISLALPIDRPLHHVLAERAGNEPDWGVSHALQTRTVRRPRVARGFWGESEVDRLRRENAELKQKLGEGEQSSSSKSGGILDSVGQAARGLTRLFGGSKDESIDVASRSAGLSQLPGTFGLVTSLIKPIFGLVGGMMQAAQSDVDVVMAAAESAVLRSGRLGSRVERGPIMSQSYSSMNFNGQQTTNLQLQFGVQGDRGSGTVSCDASISGGEVEFRDLRLDGSSLDWRGGGGAGQSGVIDVER